jgi:DNA polymerase-3 subunit alpha
MRVQSMEALDKAAGALDQGLRVVLDPAVVGRERANLASLKSELSQALRPSRKGGEVRIVLPLSDAGREIEIAIGGRYDVSPTVAGRVSTLPGVLEVVEI